MDPQCFTLELLQNRYVRVSGRPQLVTESPNRFYDSFINYEFVFQLHLGVYIKFVSELL